MKLISWNVNGIRAVLKKDFFGFIDKHKPEILCLQETKVPRGGMNLIELSQFEQFWNDAKKPGYAGTAIFSKTKPLSLIFGFPDDILKKYKLEDGYGDPAQQGRVVTAED